MRNLTVQQRKLLKEWFKKNYDGGCKFDLADKIDYGTYKKIENLHPTEVHSQNVNSYLEGLADINA